MGEAEIVQEVMNDCCCQKLSFQVILVAILDMQGEETVSYQTHLAYCKWTCKWIPKGQGTNIFWHEDEENDTQE